jgi:hypothetical protein
VSPVSAPPADRGVARSATPRSAARRVVWASALFVVFTVTKQIKPVYDHAPWLNDPYDTVYSFAMFFVPATTVFVVVELLLHRGNTPDVRSRVTVRGCRAGVALMAATVVSCWVSVADGANRAQWTTAATVPLVAGLAALTAAVAVAGIAALRTRGLPARGVDVGQDWLAQLAVAARSDLRWAGPLGPAIRRGVDWLDGRLGPHLRRHPILTAVAASAAFGIAVGVNQGLQEHYFVASTLLTVGLLGVGMFAFLIVTGAYLEIIRPSSPLLPNSRRALDACVAGCGAALICLALRNWLWWAVGTTATTASNLQLALLETGGMAVAFAAVFAAESLLGTHRSNLADR